MTFAFAELHLAKVWRKRAVIKPEKNKAALNLGDSIKITSSAKVFPLAAAAHTI